ncbi:MAG: hypothetical protein ABSC29_03320 [Minisyncoccia bacterium]
MPTVEGEITPCWFEPTDCAPDQSLSAGEAEAVQAVAFVVVQKSEADCPTVMGEGETERETAGVVPVLTVKSTSLDWTFGEENCAHSVQEPMVRPEA